MHLLSTLNPTNLNLPDVPVLIFKRGEKRTFVSRPESYDEMVLVAKRIFNLEQHVVPAFEVKTLVVCNGRSIELDESAYPAMMHYLDEIEVVTTSAAAPVFENVGTAVSSAAVHDTGLTTDTTTKSSASKGKRKDRSKEEEPVASTSKVVSKPRVSSEKQRETKPTPKQSGPIFSDPPKSPRPSSSVNGAASGLSAQDPHNLFDEGIPVEYASPAKKRRNYVNADKEDVATPTKASTSSASSSTQTGHSKSQSSEWEQIEVPAQAPNGQLSESETSKAPKGKEKSSQGSEHDSETTIKMKKEKITGAASTPTVKSPLKSSSTKNHAHEETAVGSSLEPSSTQDTADGGHDEMPDTRFKIFIEGPEATHKAEFMTRSRHPVRKVLTKACETFNLDSTGASLQLVVEVEVDGENYEECYLCAIDETIGQAGVYANARLRVVVEDGGEDEAEGYF